MAKLDWNNIDKKLTKDYETILADYIPRDCFTKADFRKIIYSYMVNNFQYRADTNKPAKELNDMIFDHVGSIQNLARYYKLLLEKADIPAYYVTFKGEDGKVFAFNLVFDEDNNTFSFDDVTFGILNKDINSYFDFDINKAHEYHQGIVKDIDSCYMELIPEEFVYVYLFKKEKPKTDIIKRLIKNRENAKKYINDNKVEIECHFDDTEKRKGSR